MADDITTSCAFCKHFQQLDDKDAGWCKLDGDIIEGMYNYRGLECFTEKPNVNM